MKPTILVDVDGVLADFMGLICRELSNRGQSRHPDEFKYHDLSLTLSLQELQVFVELAYTEGLAAKISWYPNAELFLGRLHQLGEVFAVTAPWKSRSWAGERGAWLQPHIRPDHVLSVPAAAKSLIRGDILIEDNSQTAYEWVEANPSGLALLIDRPWNQPCWDHVNHPRIFRVHNYRAALALCRWEFEVVS